MAETTTTSKEATPETAVPQLAVRTFGEKKTVKEALPEWMVKQVSLSTIAQAVYVEQRRARIRRAHTKGRAEVRGGGRKPWKQKGTGRARAGSRRSPIWVGGGITFGPRARKERSLFQSKSQKRLALCGALFAQAQREALEVVKLPETVPVKTRDLVAKLNDAYSILMVVDESHKDIARAARNIPSVRVVLANRVTVRNIAEANTVWIDEKAMPILESRCK